MSICLCMIIKNEAESLNHFLKRLKPYMKQIIIIDTGSTDSSKNIAKKFTKEVYDFKWCNDFSLARKFSIKYAKMDWILWLDPDEHIKIADLKKLKSLTKNKDYLGYRFIQETKINKKKYTQGICKLFKNHKNIKFVYSIHESVMPSIRKINGKIGKSNITIKHKSKYTKEKVEYYSTLLNKKLRDFPDSNVVKEKEILQKICNNF